MSILALLPLLMLPASSRPPAHVPTPAPAGGWPPAHVGPITQPVHRLG